MILKRGNLSALFLLRFPGTKKAASSCGGGCDAGCTLAALYERQTVVAFLVQVVYLLLLFLQQFHKFFYGFGVVVSGLVLYCLL